MTDRTNRTDAGATLVEYSLLVALIALVCFLAVEAMGSSAGDSYSRSARSIQEAS